MSPSLIPSVRPDYDQMRTFLGIIMDPLVGCCELRLWDAKFDFSGFITEQHQYKNVLSGWYDDPNKLVVDAARIRGVSAYVTVNPVNPALLARADNKLIKAKNATADENIVCLRWLFIDCDAVRPTGISSTDEELAAALARRDLILSDHPEIARSGLWGCSGNGGWILSRLPDYPNDDEHRARIARGMTALSERYTDHLVKIDTTTKNPSRIMPLVGSVKAKGSNRPERPWRLATMDERRPDDVL